eukprot:NODE_1169_length_973_cov_16.605201_g1124_i0.p1 GENE.NODE_1169_length_973_cov_16.605201_g1124_i0~~NODE_1169_length_973_cov_16.605201_g1124_i0.p1  ORF type:complete len:318 (-),score=45.49 NODE_1169_length_973_cov_16.605201_g1124_i0:18-971(-)
MGEHGQFSNCLLGDHGVTALLETCRVVLGLKTLSVDSNDISNQGASTLLRTLRRHPTLQCISICDNHMFETAGQDLLLLLRNNPKITTLKVWGNDFTPYLLKRLGRQQDLNADVQQQLQRKRRARQREFVLQGTAITHPSALKHRTIQIAQQAWDMVRYELDKSADFLRRYEQGCKAAFDDPNKGLDRVTLFLLNSLGKGCPVYREIPNPDKPVEFPGLEAPSRVSDTRLFLFVWDIILPFITTHWDTIVVFLEDLGHFYYEAGVRLLHYDLLEPVLLTALQYGLGSAHNAEFEDSWRQVFTLVSRAMARKVPDQYE